jgi:OmcA/MtrC family decaheme c-type cytochrome
MRENPLQIVGFQGFSTYVYDEEHVHFPGQLNDCTICHAEDTYALPLSADVLGSTIDTGEDHRSPLDDSVITPTAAACSSCHDGASAQQHMEQNGASFGTTQAAIDDGDVVEQCGTCHGSGRTYDVDRVHGLASAENGS